MRLHTDIKLFSDTVRAAAQHLKINEVFVEKDYWITLVLSNLVKSKHAGNTVFKGGTSLSKAFGLINRFSEDVDIAIIDQNNRSGNEIKTLIRAVEKAMTNELKELNVEGLTSKGSRFRKSVFEYVTIDARNQNNKLIVEVNSFSNPYPFQPLIIKSLIFDFLKQTGNVKYIEQSDLHPFTINVLNKEQTLIEKLVSLIRFSFEENSTVSISKKIRHFYDLYFLLNDTECNIFIKSDNFKKQFNEIFNHDKQLFDEPKGWQAKTIAESPLITDFENIWKQLNDIYKTELSALAFAEIPDEAKVAQAFITLIQQIKQQ